MAGPQKRKFKTTAVPKSGAGKPKNETAASVKTATDKPTTPNLVVQTQFYTSPFEVISDLDYLPSMHVWT
jgi:hypothetical protein